MRPPQTRSIFESSWQAGTSKVHGPALAEHVASFEARQVKEVSDYVECEGIYCDFEETRVFGVCLHEAGRDKAESDLAALTDADIFDCKSIGLLLWHKN
jgi:hypothetical protein